MSKFINRDIKIFHRISYFLIVGLIFFIQFYEFLHLHHFHEADSVVVETIYPPLDVEVEHSSTHQHEGDEDNQHKYKNQIDWSFISSRFSNNLTFEPLILFFTTVSQSPLVIEKSITPHQIPFQIKDYFVSFLIIRGPPLSTYQKNY